MPGQQQRKGSHGHESGQHRQHLHNPTGYTDEVADEEREFMMQAERSAGQGTEQSSQSAGQSTKMKGGMEGHKGSSGTGSTK